MEISANIGSVLNKLTCLDRDLGKREQKGEKEKEETEREKEWKVE